MTRSRSRRDRLGRLAARVIAALLGGAMLVGVVAGDAGAQTAAARAPALEPLVLPGDQRFACTRDTTPLAAVADVPPSSSFVRFEFGRTSSDGREIFAMLDSVGRVLAFVDESTTSTGPTSSGTVTYHVGFDPDGSIHGLRQVAGDKRGESGRESTVGIWARHDSLSASERKRARALADWIVAHRCDRPARR